MATPAWSPGTLYPPGSLVRPRTALPTSIVALTNPGFEDGITDWTVPAGATSETDGKYSGSRSLRFTGTAGEVYARHAPSPCVPGSNISASCMYQQGAASSGHNPGTVYIRFLDDDDNQVGAYFFGNVVSSGSGGAWHRSSVSGAIAPSGATQVEVGIRVNRTNGNASWADAFAWSLVGGAPAGLIFKATQAATGRSADVEPAWPLTTGVEVTDNQVTWEGVIANRVVWQASPIMRSGSVEPEWSDGVGSYTLDGTINWRATSSQITDPRCPNTKIVTIMVSKVFCADDDIVAYSATTNPRDWSKVKDAGYLPTGLNVLGSNPVAGLGPYRGNLIVSNAEGFQMWQVDEDPANMAILDALPIGSEEHWAMAPVSNDLFMLASQGVRTIGIAAASTNLAAGDVGLPVDPLVRVNHKAAKAAGERVHGFYFPGAGQYFLCFNLPGNWPIRTELWPDGYDYQCVAHVYTMSQIGSVGAWSRYLFPFRVDAWAIIGDMVVIRSGDDIIELDEDLVNDFVMDEDGHADVGQPFPGVIWWPWLDFGSPGYEKSTEGFDIVSIGSPAVEIGFAQQQDPDDDTYFTEPYQLDPDTITGDLIPYEMTAPSMSVRLTYNGGEKWRFLAMNLYLYTRRG